MNNYNFQKTALASALLVAFSAPSVYADPADMSRTQGARAKMEDKKQNNRNQKDRTHEDQSQEDRNETNKILRNAGDTYTSLLDKTGIPRDLVAKANCVAVIPNVRSLALVVGRQSGNGVISCKTSGEDMSKWSNPAFVKLSSTSIGAQAGSESKDMVFFIVGDKESRRFIDGSTTFGTDLNVVAGPVSGGIDKNFRIGSGVYTYASEESGVFAGLSLSGGDVSLDNENNKKFYGKELEVEEALSMKEPSELPGAGKEFTDALSSTPEKVKQN